MESVSRISQRLGCSLAGLAVAVTLAIAASPVDQARELYQRTDYEAALKLLRPLPNKDAAAYHLIGMCYYMQGDPRKAGDFFEKAVELRPRESDYYLWLGRAYGRRAETSSFLTAPGYAAKARDSFEKAVQLDPAEHGGDQRPVRVLSGSPGDSRRRVWIGRRSWRRTWPK